MRNVLITGASSGIGLALVRLFASRGDRVALLARRADLLEKHANDIIAAGGQALVLPCDVADAAAVADSVAQVRAQWGSVDVAIANAGIGRSTPVERLSFDDVEEVLRVNFLGVVGLVAAVVPDMIEKRQGHIVGVGSLAGLRGWPMYAAYAASKAAMQTFLESARVELHRHGIAVTIVNPGFVETPMTADNAFKMPFIVSAETAAKVVAQAIDRRAREVNFPQPVATAVRVLRWMPNWAYDKLAGATPGAHKAGNIRQP